MAVRDEFMGDVRSVLRSAGVSVVSSEQSRITLPAAGVFFSGYEYDGIYRRIIRATVNLGLLPTDSTADDDNIVNKLEPILSAIEERITVTDVGGTADVEIVGGVVYRGVTIEVEALM